jgi:hypothetical protein
MEIEATFRVEQSKVFDEKGNVKQAVIDDAIANIVEEATDTILHGVKDKIRGLKMRWRGHFYDSTKSKKINDKHWQVINDVLSGSGYPYGTVIEYGFRGMPEKKIWLIGAPELQQWLIEKHGWSKTKERGVLQKGDMRITYVTVRHEGKHPFREGFYATKDKWVYSALKGIEKALNY